MFHDTSLVDRFLFFTCFPPQHLWVPGNEIQGIGMGNTGSRTNLNWRCWSGEPRRTGIVRGSLVPRRDQSTVKAAAHQSRVLKSPQDWPELRGWLVSICALEQAQPPSPDSHHLVISSLLALSPTPLVSPTPFVNPPGCLQPSFLELVPWASPLPWGGFKGWAELSA